jgi:hypothetical protein
MYDVATRDRTLKLLAQGLPASEISRRIGVSRFAIREWRLRTEQGRPLYVGGSRACPRCTEIPTLPEPQASYAYLLGLYLGDGCISRTHREGVFILRIICADAWPGLKGECRRALEAIRPDNKVGTVQRQGCSDIRSYSSHWPCLFPQYGAGKKHNRKIELASWQQEIVTKHPEELVRGLIHSDGCRILNRVRRPLPSGERWYEYPRYLFVNESTDIRVLFTDALDRLDIEWRRSKPNTVSVAKRKAVARLDEFVGPKY